MTTVYSQLNRLRQRKEELLSRARSHSIPPDLMTEIHSFDERASSTLKAGIHVDEWQLERLGAICDSLDTQLSRAIKASARIIHHGQRVQADAIRRSGKKLGNDVIAGGAVAGALALVGGIIAGELIGKAIERKQTKDDRQRTGLLALIRRLAATKPYLTFRYIVDAAGSDSSGIMSEKKARLHLSALIDEGVVEKYDIGNVRALRLVNSNRPVLEEIPCMKS